MLFLELDMPPKLKLLFILCVFFSGPLCAQTSVEILPTGRLFRLSFPDPREIRMSLAFESDSKIHAMVGNYFSLIGFGDAEATFPWTAHFGIEGAGYFTMRQEGSRFPLETADGLLGVYLEGASGPWQAQLRFTHISAHLADGSNDVPIAYSRETLITRLGYQFGELANVYAGLHFLAHTIPELPPVGFQLGGIYFWDLGSRKLTPFSAADFKWRGESDRNPSISVQLGIALNNPIEAYRSFRFYYHYYTGADPRGQFYTRTYTAHSLGIEMQI